MKKIIFVVAIVFSGMLMQAQTYSAWSNVFVNGEFGNNWSKTSSLIHTFTNKGNGVYELNVSNVGSVKVKFSYMEKGMYVYLPYGNPSFDNAFGGNSNKLVKLYSTGKLSEFANGNGKGHIYATKMNGYGMAYKLL